MYSREPIRGRAEISVALGIDRRTFTRLVNEGAVADDDPVVSGQYVIPGLGRVVCEGHSRYALQPTFPLPDVKAPIHAAMPRPAHFCLVHRDGAVLGTLLEVVQGRRPYVMMCEPPDCTSGQNRYAVLPLDQEMQPLSDWPSCPPPGTYLE